jgi:uracil-DNA glycosylase family 4
MDNATRLQYLHAMGIESWILHAPASAVSPVSAAQPVLATPAPIFSPEPSLPAPVPKITPVEPPLPAPVVFSDSWQHLQADVASCQKCPLCQTRTQTVFGSGNQKATWLFIGEAPGEQEDLQGLPFVGVAGTLLTEMIRAMGLQREQVYIANIVKCRPPKNRDPHVEEIVACQPFLQRQLALLQPKILVAVGRIAAQQLLNTHEPLAKLRGKVYQFNQIPLLVVYHPAYLLRDLRQKSKAWQDLQVAMKTYQTI